MCTFLLCFCSIIKSATCSEGHQYGLGYGKRSFRKVSAFRQTQPQGFLMDSLLRYPMGYLSHRFHLCAPYVLPSAFPQYIPPRTFPSTLRTPTGSSENQTNRLPVCLLLLSLCIAVDHVRHIPRQLPWVPLDFHWTFLRAFLLSQSCTFRHVPGGFLLRCRYICSVFPHEFARLFYRSFSNAFPASFSKPSPRGAP